MNISIGTLRRWTWISALTTAVTMAALVWALPGAAQDAASTGDGLTLAVAAAELESAQEALGALPADAAPDTPESAQRTALERKVALLEEYIGHETTLTEIQAQASAPADRLAALGAEREALAAEPPPAPPIDPTPDGFDAMRGEVTAQRERVEALQSRLSESASLANSAPERLAALTARAAEAEAAAQRLAAQADGEADGARKALLTLQAENARLDRWTARKAAEALEARVAAAQALEPLHTAELDLEEVKLARLEAAFAHYGEALEGRLAAEQAQMDAEVARKEELAETAVTEPERFIAEREAEVARSTRNQSDLQSFQVRLQKDVAEQEKRLAAEKTELENLRDYLDRTGMSAQAADRVKLMLRQLKQRQSLIDRMLQDGVQQALGEYRARRFEIEDLLFDLSTRWQEAQEAAAADLPEAERAAFLAQSSELLERYRTVLRDERTLLTETISLAQQLVNVTLARADTASETRRFIRSRAFWLRDGAPLTWGTVTAAASETGKLTAWAGELGSPAMRARLAEVVRSPQTLFFAVLLLVVLPIVLLVLRKRLRALVAKRNVQTAGTQSRGGDKTYAVVFAVLSAALLPAYFLLAARLIGFADLPGAIADVATPSVTHFAYFLFLWLFLRTLFAESGVANVQFGVPMEAVVALRRAARMGLAAYIVFLVPSLILSAPPFQAESWARLAYTLFEIAAAVAVVRLFWPGSAFVQFALDFSGKGFLTRYWGPIRGAAYLLSGGIVVLDVIGYRYAAQSLLVSFAYTLLVVLVLPALHLMFAAAVQSMAARPGRRRMASDSEAPSYQATAQIQRFARMAFILVGVVLVAGFWGIDEQALTTLDEFEIYPVSLADGMQEHVTAADVARFILYIAVMVWLLKSLPGIYEFAVFPRVRLDDGAKYALLTMSRYGIFAVGIVLALSEIHLDLGRLGWLVAAVGVGLGFGLQEIVSNFVSGIILLVERPVQVNDIVTIGNISGTVRRINIRATTLVNFDMQEVVLPNRNLITQEVTNWTRGDTVNRLVINLGVAYGSNVDEVAALLDRIARAHPQVLDDPEPSIIFMDHGESSLDFAIRVYIPSPAVLMTVRDELNKTINHEFAARGIEIPFPQRDLHIRSSAVDLGSPRKRGDA